MSGGFYVVVTGFDQQVKCQLLNAMARQKDKFHQFSCRRSPIVRSIKHITVGGHTMNLVQTPSLGTPGWTKVETDFKVSYPWTTDNRIFFYVKTEPSNVDDESSIQALHNTFGKEYVRVVVCYCQQSRVDGANVKYTFNLDANFETQIGQSQTLLKDLAQKKTQRPKTCQVGSDKPFEKSVSKPSNEEHQEAIAKVSTVNVAEQENQPVKTSPKKEKISPEDWELFDITLRLGAARSNHLRVNVVGNHGVGKTTLVKRLLQQEVKCPDPHQSSTENLEVHHLMARCVERSGEKVWEHDSSGTYSFLEDLNIQRMAQAMIKTEEWFEPKSYIVKSLKGKKTPNPKDSSDEIFEFGSEEVDDTYLESEKNTCAQSTTPFDNLTRLKEKEGYLRKVLQCKEQLEKENQEKQYVSYWDFAGQATYYATHQLFMSPSAVYLVMIDLRKELDDEVTDNLEFRSGILQSCTVKEALKYWIHAVQAYTKDENGAHAPIIIVGTHKGEMSDEGQYLSKFKEIRKMFRTNFECVAVENSVGLQKDQALRTLQNMIIDKGLGVIDKKVSTQWINLEYDMQLTIDKNMAKYLTLTQVQKLDQNMDVPMGNIDRLEAFLCHQHYKGKLLYYNHQDLKNFIITDPMLLVKYLNMLLRRTEQDAPSTLDWNEDGILNQSYIQTIARKVNADEYASIMMVKILVKLNILHPLPFQNEDRYFLPCLLPDVPHDTESEDDECTRSSLFQMSFNIDSIYQTTYHQIVCVLLKTVPLIEENNEKLIYNLQAHFDLDGNGFRWLILYWEESKLYFYVKDFDKGSKYPMNKSIDEVMKLLEDSIEEVLSTNQHGNVEYIFYIQCPKHNRCFLSLCDLKENAKVICPGIGKGQVQKRHTINVSDIESVTQDQPESKDENPVMKQKPSDVVLGRLAWKMKMLGRKTSELALHLKMQEAYTKADVATRDYNDAGTDLLCILISWRNQNRNNTTSKLLNLLCKRDCFDRTDLEQALFSPAKTDTRLNNIPDDAAVDNKDIVLISNHLCSGFTFVLIELGVKMEEVDQERRNHIGDTKEMIRQLLQRSRYKKPMEVTTRAILEAMRMLDLPLDPILMKLTSR